MNFIKHPAACLASMACVFATGGSVGAHAAEPANYAGFHVGSNDLKNWPATVGLGAGVSVPGELSLDGKANWGAMFGRQYDNSRYEIEYQSGKFDITAIRLGAVRQQVSAGGSYKALTLNAYRTQPFSANWTGYAGLGLGWGKASLPALGFTGGCNCFSAASGSGAAYLGRLGLEYKFDQRHNTFAQYTVLSLPKSSGGPPQTSYGRKSVGILSIGYRHVF